MSFDCPKCGKPFTAVKESVWPDGTVCISYVHTREVEYKPGKFKDRTTYCAVNTEKKAPIPKLEHGNLSPLRPMKGGIRG